MKLDGETSLLVDGDDMIIVDKIDDASLELLKMGIADSSFEVLSCATDEECRCDVGVCVGDLNQFGPLAQTYIADIEAAGREPVRQMRQELVCQAKARFPNQPFIEDSNHCD